MYYGSETLLNFSKQRYYELLELEKLDQLDEETTEILEYYDEIACAQINWEMKQQYFTILKDYCTGKFDEPTLWIKLREISESASKLQEITRQYSFVISPHLKCLELHVKIHDLLINVEQYTEEWNDAEFEEKLKDLNSYFQTFKNECVRDSKVILKLILEN